MSPLIQCLHRSVSKCWFPFTSSVSCYIILTLVGRMVTALHDFTMPSTYSTMGSFSRYLVKTIFTEHLLQCTERKYPRDSTPTQLTEYQSPSQVVWVFLAKSVKLPVSDSLWSELG